MPLLRKKQKEKKQMVKDSYETLCKMSNGDGFNRKDGSLVHGLIELVISFLKKLTEKIKNGK